VGRSTQDIVGDTMRDNAEAKVYLGRFYCNTSKGGAEYIKGRLGAATVLGFYKTLNDGTRVLDLQLVNEERKAKPAATSAAGIDNVDTIPF